MALIAFGVSDGLASSISAIAAVTTGADMLVPVRRRYGSELVGVVPHKRAAGFEANSALVASVVDSMPTPGATRSGFAVLLIAAGPRELNPATMSSLRSAVPI